MEPVPGDLPGEAQRHKEVVHLLADVVLIQEGDHGVHVLLPAEVPHGDRRHPGVDAPQLPGASVGRDGGRAGVLLPAEVSRNDRAGRAGRRVVPGGREQVSSMHRGPTGITPHVSAHHSGWRPRSAGRAGRRGFPGGKERASHISRPTGGGNPGIGGECRRSPCRAGWGGHRVSPGGREGVSPSNRRNTGGCTPGIRADRVRWCPRSAGCGRGHLVCRRDAGGLALKPAPRLPPALQIAAVRTIVIGRACRMLLWAGVNPPVLGPWVPQRLGHAGAAGRLLAPASRPPSAGRPRRPDPPMPLVSANLAVGPGPGFASQASLRRRRSGS
mmetsp:Transcript_26364/g.68160  ORF Transcript_26364/g.68160 Transcript_26364/m.68160 type:complete len:328 (+) Transcript_26364:379-1362(+)